MVNLKVLIDSCYKYICSYNLFIPDENDYDDNDELEPQESQILLKHQKYTTRLYILFFIISLYVLFSISLMKTQTQTIPITHITLDIFQQMYLKYNKSLLCLCSNDSIQYKTFISNSIKIHPVCSSIFVNQSWIKSMYFSNASRYGVTDFRTTANAQFQLLANLCLLSQDTILYNEINLNNSEYVTMYLLPEIQVHREVNSTIKFLNIYGSTRIISALDYVSTTILASHLVSSLNTNIVFSITSNRKKYIIHPMITMRCENIQDNTFEKNCVSCGREDPISEVGFYSISNDLNHRSHVEWSLPKFDSILVKGFFGGCTPFQALLHSTLDCLYDIKCIELLIEYFSDLNQMNYNWSNYILSSKSENKSVNDLLHNLFINERSIQINYSKYFNECSPSICTYIKIHQINLSYSITLFISLYGGLIIILRLIASFLIKILFKYQLRNININSLINTNYIYQFSQWLRKLNLFKMINKQTENDIKEQKIITRVYLILLTVSFLILILLTSLDTEIVLTTESNPSLLTYNNLQRFYSNSLRCPCSITTISHDKFISLSPILHQICSSYFVQNQWIDLTRSFVFLWNYNDWRRRTYSYFKLLSDLCQLSTKTTDNAVQRFLSQSFITSNVIIENDFNQRFNATLDQFYQSTITYFNLLIDIIYLLTQVDQPYTESGKHLIDGDFITNLNISIIPNNQEILQLKLILTKINDFNSTSINCLCATNPYCKSLNIINRSQIIFDKNNSYNDIYIPPGLVSACSTMHSVLFSTLECFYSNYDCLTIFLKYMFERIPNEDHFVWESQIRPFIYNSSIHRFPPNISVAMIVRNIMIEDWNASIFYNRFYQSCSPMYCTYQQKRRVKTNIEVLITFVSMIGGLTVSIHLITPHFVHIIFYLFELINKKQQQQVHLKYFDRLKLFIRNLVTLLYEIASNLNIFSRRDFNSILDQTTAKYFGRWATRLYIILLIIGIIILALFTFIQPQTLTKTFDKPSIDTYNNLIQIYGNKLECSCSFVASEYNKFIEIQPIFHEVCSSPFISDEWRINITLNLVPDLSAYEQKDYRRFLSAHLQFLQGLCRLSIQSVNDSINQTFHSLFVTSQLLSKKIFQIRIDSLIERSKPDAARIFSNLFFLIRSINHGNSIVSTYGTNFEYIVPWTNFEGTYVPTQAVVYDNQCSCSLQPNCTTPASFIMKNSTEIIFIEGLKMGCTPSESFLASNLECFYNLSCIHLLHQYTNSTYSSIYLSTTMKRSSINTTINELINNLFVDEWITKMDYLSYFEQCSPLLCSYTYIQQFNLLYTITVLFGLQGGLTIVLKWICPLLVSIIAKIYQHQTRRTNIIQPKSSQEILTIN